MGEVFLMKRLLVLGAALASVTLGAQPLDEARGKQGGTPADAPAATAFEVASVKRNKSGDGFITMGMQPGGRLTMMNVPVRQLIVRAYQVQPYQVLGGPSWITSDRFDITAKAPGDASPQQMNAMLEALLADRFKLKVRRETRQSDVYRLVKARADGRLGDAIKPAAVECNMGRGRAGAPGPGTNAAPPPGPAVARFGGPAGPGGAAPPCRFMIAPGRFEAMGQSISAFASTIATQLGRPVLDETGLTGVYDFTLTYMPDSGGRGMPAGLPSGLAQPGAPELPPIDPNAPALPTALQEQLGLRLESGKGPVEMIVIDSIDQPTED
jgi:uncharacterized protein (TIGR03435 family)